jgi:hypothetical protein
MSSRTVGGPKPSAFQSFRCSAPRLQKCPFCCRYKVTDFATRLNRDKLRAVFDSLIAPATALTVAILALTKTFMGTRDNDVRGTTGAPVEFPIQQS